MLDPGPRRCRGSGPGGHGSDSAGSAVPAPARAVPAAPGQVTVLRGRTKPVAARTLALLRPGDRLDLPDSLDMTFAVNAIRPPGRRSVARRPRFGARCRVDEALLAQFVLAPRTPAPGQVPTPPARLARPARHAPDSPGQCGTPPTGTAGMDERGGRRERPTRVGGLASARRAGPQRADRTRRRAGPSWRIPCRDGV